MQAFQVINKIGQNVQIQIEGVGTIRQIELAQKMYYLGHLQYKAMRNATTIRLHDNLINKAINELNLYPKQF